jgi:hypothetical protein
MPALRLYLDENVDQRILPDLQRAGCTVRTVQDAQTGEATDDAQLRFATDRGYLLVTHNQLHFRRRHQQVVRGDRPHGGIVLTPHTMPLSRLRVRAPLVAAWLRTFDDHQSRLHTWGELQQRLIHGYRPPDSGCAEDDVRHALAWR